MDVDAIMNRKYALYNAAAMDERHEREREGGKALDECVSFIYNNISLLGGEKKSN